MPMLLKYLTKPELKDRKRERLTCTASVLYLIIYKLHPLSA